MTLLSDEGLVVPIEPEPSTARRIVAAVVLQAFKDVESMEKRRARYPEAKPMGRELDAQEWLQDTTATRPFSYRWCLDALSLQPVHGTSPRPD